MPRRYPIMQFPNKSLLVAMLAGAVARAARGRTARTAALMSALAQLVWARQEITDGANGFRRFLGVAGAVRAAAVLLGRARPPGRRPPDA